MTEDIRGSGGSLGPPFTVDVLADLHAGALAPEVSARLWSQVDADPQARAILRALDSVTADLGGLGSAPVEPMPARFAADLDSALAAEAARAGLGRRQAPQHHPGAAPVIDLAAARKRRSRRMAIGAGLLTAAAAAVAVTFAVLPGTAPTTGGVANPAPTTGSAQQTQTAPGDQAPLPVTSTDIGAAVGKIGDTKDYGDLGGPERLAQCVQANGIDPKSQVIGVRPVTLDGKPGVMALLTTGELAQFRVLVVETSCGPDKPGTLFNGTVGR